MFNRQCECCGTWDQPIGPTYLRPEVQKEIDAAIMNANGQTKQIMIPTPEGGLTRAEWDYLESMWKSFQSTYNKFQLLFNP